MSETLASAIDPAIPRRMYWDYQVADPKRCPKCNAELIQDTQSYAILIDKEKQQESYVLGTDGGHFCPECPVVVLDSNNFREMLMADGGNAEHVRVVGLVNLNAIPDDKADEPLGTDDNPVPVVEFIFSDTVRRTEGKVGRNDPCPCGSGKKYKKCCGN